MQEIDYEIMPPGQWINEELTEKETAEFIAVSYLLNDKAATTGNEAADLVEKTFPYFNTIMHMMYLLNRNAGKMTLYDEGVLLEDKPVNLIDYTFNFIMGVVEENAEIDLKALVKAAQLKQTFSTIRQGPATNQLTKIKTDKNTQPDKFTGIAEIKGDNGFKVSIRNFNDIGGLKTSTHKLLDAITLQFTESGAKYRTVELKLSDYMNLCQLKDRKEAIKQVKSDLETLIKVSISLNDKSKGDGKYIELNMFSAVGLNKGVICANFTEEYYNLMLRYPVMPYPVELLRLNSRKNPNSYCLGRRITEHKNMNFDKPNADIISVSTLLKASSYIPTYAEINAKDRAFTRRIIEPFERDLNALSNIFTWEYCHSNSEPLADEELQSFSYDLFKDLQIHISWKMYPDMSKRLAVKNERLEKNKTNKTASKKKTAAKKEGVAHSKKGGSVQQIGG